MAQLNEPASDTPGGYTPAALRAVAQQGGTRGPTALPSDLRKARWPEIEDQLLRGC